jgi:hypothetical protein
MQNTDISTLLTAALLGMGCSSELISELDAHSDIVLDFHDQPSIYLSIEGEHVRCSAALGGRHNYRQVLEMHGVPIGMEMIKDVPFAHAGSLMLRVRDETLQVTTLIHPDYLTDSTRFGEALNGYFVSVTELHAILGA